MTKEYLVSYDFGTVTAYIEAESKEDAESQAYDMFNDTPELRNEIRIDYLTIEEEDSNA